MLQYDHRWVSYLSQVCVCVCVTVWSQVGELPVSGVCMCVCYRMITGGWVTCLRCVYVLQCDHRWVSYLSQVCVCVTVWSQVGELPVSGVCMCYSMITGGWVTCLRCVCVCYSMITGGWVTCLSGWLIESRHQWRMWFVMETQSTDIQVSLSMSLTPCGLVRIDLYHFLAGCRTGQLNQALSVTSGS